MYYLLILLLAKTIVVEAKNDTIIHGWHAEPDGRGTWSILWSCLATIFICNWSALHLRVPTKHGVWYQFFRKIKYMLWAVLIPEFFLTQAFYNFFQARALLKDLVQYAGSEWTSTHAQFAVAKGFFVREQEGERFGPEALQSLARSGRLTAPSISEDALRSRGKTDAIIKLVAVLQIAWFGLQTLIRAIQHLPITALEIVTTAFIFCSLLTYGLWWNQPQNIEYPVSIEVRLCQPIKDKTAAPPFSSSPLFTWITRDRIETSWISLLLTILASTFGAIHCLAWNTHFPTSEERLAWRIFSVVTTFLPTVLGPILYYGDIGDRDGKEEFLQRVFFLLILVLHVIGRITIIVLAFIALRALPADAYQTINWNEYLPHFAA